MNPYLSSFAKRLLASCAILGALSFVWTPRKKGESIGDVRYSILEPKVFMELNEGWILMDGGASKESADIFPGSTLHLEFQCETLPDARGVFIRGMNHHRSANGDPWGDRQVGSFQADTLVSHTHHIPNGVTDDNKGNTMRGGQFNRNASEGESRSFGGTETRPRNIALYVYIKVK